MGQNNSKNNKVHPNTESYNNLETEHNLLHKGSFKEIIELREVSSENKYKIKINKSKFKIKLSSNVENTFGYTNKNINLCDITKVIPKILYKYIYTHRGSPQKIFQLNNIRRLPINTMYGKTIWIENIGLFNTVDEYIITFSVSDNPLISPNIPIDFKYKLSYEPTFHAKDYKHCYIIMMDLYNSTNITKTKLPQEVALFYHRLVQKLHLLLNKSYYPCVQLVECVGDSFMLWSNPRYSFQCKYKIHTIINFVKDYYESIHEIVSEYDTYMRCGISYGDCCGGIWDGKTFRIAGNIVNLAERLEGSCIKNTINISFDAITQENLQEIKNTELTTMSLKGYGNVNFYTVKL